MSGAGMSRVLEILRSLYAHVETLDGFAGAVVYREGHQPTLVEESDSSRFKSFVREVLVCTDKALEQVPSCNQICTLPELLAFILNGLKRKRKRNVLAHGYSFLSVAQEERDADQFKFQSEVTQSAAYIHGSDLWRKVSKRLGTDMTRYLLESCAMFVSVPPSCAFQVCGAPVYDRVSVATGSMLFCLRPRPGKNPVGRSCAAGWKNKPKVRTSLQTISRTLHGKSGKRKRDSIEEDGVDSGKRMRVEPGGLAKETLQGCSDTVGSEQRPLVAVVVPKKPVVCSSNAKQPVEMFRTTPPLEAGPSWRSGLFPPLPPSQCFIRAQGMMYSGRGMRGFLLNRKINSGTEAPRRLKGQDLMRIVFFEGVSYLRGQTRKPKKLPRRFFNSVPLFNQLLRRHRGCAYGRILQDVCPWVEAGGEGPERGDLGSLLPQHCPPQRVYLFIRQCLSTVVPSELWGSDRNRVTFLTRVKSLLHSGKFERLSLAEVMWKIKVNECDWLKISKTGRSPPSELAYRTRVLGQFLAWLLDGYVLGLVRARFYVTESMGHKNSLRFYRQQVWAKLQELAFRAHISKGQLEELTPAQVASLPKTTVISRLRFIPKAGGMRPITRVVGADAKTRIHQAQVRDLLEALRACVHSKPSLLGFTVWGMADIHKALSTLAAAQKEKLQRLYFVKMDVSGAFESLPHAKLIEVIGQTLSPIQKELFVLRRYAKVWADTHEGLKKSFNRQSDFMEDNESINMKGLAMSLQQEGKVHDAILVEQQFSSDLNGQEAMEFFTQMLTSSVVKFGKRTFRQRRGIPQGSVVSSLLCCLCYGHMENHLFKGTTLNRGCLMRLVDDFLLITPDLNQAQTFFKALFAGVKDYGLVVNPQKVMVNYPVCGGFASHPDIRMLPPGGLFPWCGLLLDTCTLDVYKDYSSYAGLSLRYSFTLGFSRSAGQQMRRKLMTLLKLKCHTIFLDLKTNSLNAVYKNIYKLLLLHAYRFHVCAQSLPFGQAVAKNPLYFVRMIWDMADYTNQLIRRCNKGVGLGSGEHTGVLQREAVELLFCLSFILVLSRHRSLYRDILPRLHKRKRCLERLLGDMRLARVRQATNPRVPEEFLAIHT